MPEINIARTGAPRIEEDSRRLLAAPIPDEHEEGEHEGADEDREHIIGIHGRTEVKPICIPVMPWPFNLIFLLKIHFLGCIYYGTAFLVNIPGSTTGCVMTAGHNLWIAASTKEPGRYADKLELEPYYGGEVIDVTDRKQYMVSPEYRQSFDRLHDYGVILLPGYQQKGFGFSAIVTDNELRDKEANCGGCPGDKPLGTIWAAKGAFINFIDPKPMPRKRLHYDLDTFRGQSGSPVYIQKKKQLCRCRDPHVRKF